MCDIIGDTQGYQKQNHPINCTEKNVLIFKIICIIKLTYRLTILAIKYFYSLWLRKYLIIVIIIIYDDD